MGINEVTSGQLILFLSKFHLTFLRLVQELLLLQDTKYDWNNLLTAFEFSEAQAHIITFWNIDTLIGKHETKYQNEYFVK